MLKKLSVFGASLMVMALLVGCGETAPPSGTNTDDQRSGGLTVETLPLDDEVMDDDDAMMEDDSMMDDDAMEEGDSMEEDDAAMEEGVKEFTIDAENFSFSPNTMTVNEGDTVRITLNNLGGSHDFVIDEFDAQTEVINTGETETIEFVADKAGTFEYYCSVGSHRAMGMVGTLTVQ
ncbi:MAG: cupredoxin domain-containing protein [Candidatus Gracilibacteria bacterium]